MATATAYFRCYSRRRFVPSDLDDLLDRDLNGRVLGTIEFYRDPIRVQIPERVEAGKSFTVTVTTYGGGCVRKGETRTEVADLEANVTPFDYEIIPPHSVCLDLLVMHAHTATLRFDRAGTARITIHGRRLPQREVIVLTRTIAID